MPGASGSQAAPDMMHCEDKLLDYLMVKYIGTWVWDATSREKLEHVIEKLVPLVSKRTQKAPDLKRMYLLYVVTHSTLGLQGNWAPEESLLGVLENLRSQYSRLSDARYELRDKVDELLLEMKTVLVLQSLHGSVVGKKFKQGSAKAFGEAIKTWFPEETEEGQNDSPDSEDEDELGPFEMTEAEKERRRARMVELKLACANMGRNPQVAIRMLSLHTRDRLERQVAAFLKRAMELEGDPSLEKMWNLVATRLGFPVLLPASSLQPSSSQQQRQRALRGPNSESVGAGSPERSLLSDDAVEAAAALLGAPKLASMVELQALFPDEARGGTPPAAPPAVKPLSAGTGPSSRPVGNGPSRGGARVAANAGHPVTLLDKLMGSQEDAATGSLGRGGGGKRKAASDGVGKGEGHDEDDRGGFGDDGGVGDDGGFADAEATDVAPRGMAQATRRHQVVAARSAQGSAYVWDVEAAAAEVGAAAASLQAMAASRRPASSAAVTAGPAQGVPAPQQRPVHTRAATHQRKGQPKRRLVVAEDNDESEGAVELGGCGDMHELKGDTREGAGGGRGTRGVDQGPPSKGRPNAAAGGTISAGAAPPSIIPTQRSMPLGRQATESDGYLAARQLRESRIALKGIGVDPLAEAVLVGQQVAGTLGARAVPGAGPGTGAGRRAGEGAALAGGSARQAPVVGRKDAEDAQRIADAAAEGGSPQQARPTGAAGVLAGAGGGGGVAVAGRVQAQPQQRRSLMDYQPTARKVQWSPSQEEDEIEESDDGQAGADAGGGDGSPLRAPPPRLPVAPVTATAMAGILVPYNPDRARRVVKRWTLAEETLFLQEVKKHGLGNWKPVLSNNAEQFVGRTTVDLKDKWRNLVKAGKVNPETFFS
eukprot:jgi/Mesvir1/12251/Mv00468-RA.2